MKTYAEQFYLRSNKKISEIHKSLKTLPKNENNFEIILESQRNRGILSFKEIRKKYTEESIENITLLSFTENRFLKRLQKINTSPWNKDTIEYLIHTIDMYCKQVNTNPTLLLKPTESLMNQYKTVFSLILEDTRSSIEMISQFIIQSHSINQSQKDLFAKKFWIKKI